MVSGEWCLRTSDYLPTDLSPPDFGLIPFGLIASRRQSGDKLGK